MKSIVDNRRHRRIVTLVCSTLILAAVLALVFTFSERGAGRLYPADGVLDLKYWAPDESGILNLDGEWDFYWERFLTTEELAGGEATPDLTAYTPAVWNSYKINGENLPGYGYATYLLRVVNARPGEPLALRIPTFSTAYELYIDGRLVSFNGRIGTTSSQHSPWYEPEVVEFTPSSDSFALIFHVSNFTYARGGMWYAVNLGSPEQIRNMDKTISDKDLFLFGALTIMALYYIGVFLLRRQDKSSLFFVLMCVTFASRTAIYGDFLILRLLPFIGFKAIITIDYITLCWFSIFSAFMIGTLFPEENSRVVLRAALIYGSVMALIFLLAPIVVFTQLVNVVQVMAIFFGAYSIAALIVAYIRGKRDSLFVLLGALAVIVCAVHDMLYQNNVILSNVGELVPFGLFILLFMQALILARRSAEAYRNVNALSQELLRLDKIKDEFLANTSHELRTPLNGILGIADAMLKGGDGELSASQRQDLSLIAGSSRRLANLVNDILDYSRMKNGDILLNIRPIQIEGLIYTVVKVFRQLSQEREYTIVSEIPENLPPVLADENRVVQILYNLIGNAAKFTVQGVINISAAVKSGGMLEVCIADTGQGIPEDHLENIFKSFEQIDTSLTRRHGGAGLGLPITKQLVELQGGTVRAESHLGEGSRFWFTLPLAAKVAMDKPGSREADPEGPADGPVDFNGDPAVSAVADSGETPLRADTGEISDKAKAVLRNSRILLVDDDTVSLKAASSTLRLGGYSVVTAGSGRAALAELVRNRDFSVVILDVMMPEMSGYEVCLKIRESRPAFELPVLMLTARASTRDILAGFESGANDYLPKPYEPEELLSRVGTLADLKASVDKAMAAESAFMQAQIKPHFLFNTLNAISSFCDSDPERAQSLIDDFSEYLRHSFDFKGLEETGPLESELSLVNSYVEIERARFGESLQVAFNVDDLAGVRLPRLSIQPLVENAIAHGLRKKNGGGTVTVSVRKSPEGVRVCVEDDGQGIPPEKLEGLLTSPSERGIGLWNIDRRLKKVYGAGLIIESAPGAGTSVSYFIPAGGDRN